jgi:spermidine synthase
MRVEFEELAFHRTALGELSLRRRTELALGTEVYEVKLGDAFLMTSLFTEGEVALAELGLADLSSGPLDVVVAGLGLGYTARAVLSHPGVRAMLLVEALAEVIAWHRQGLVPLGTELTSDPRTEIIRGDFFAQAASPGIDPRSPGRKFHAILLDIDHSPRHVLHPSHAAMYTADGLYRLASHLHPGGAFGLWSNDPPDERFEALLRKVFATCSTHLVQFHNPLQNRSASNTVYVARSGTR